MEDDVKFAAAVTKGLASLDRGEFIGHEEVGKRTVGELARAILGRTAISGALGHWLPVAGSVISYLACGRLVQSPQLLQVLEQNWTIKSSVYGVPGPTMMSTMSTP